MAVDFFLKIDGIEGEATQAKVEKQIQLLSWSWGESNSGSAASGGGSGSGKVSMQDFHFTMQACKASPKLFLAVATGEHIKSAQLTCRKAGKEQHDYLVIKFSDVLISSYQIGGSEGSNELPVDQVSFNFKKIEWEYKEQKADGTLGSPVKAGFDLSTGKKV